MESGEADMVLQAPCSTTWERSGLDASIAEAGLSAEEFIISWRIRACLLACWKD